MKKKDLMKIVGVVAILLVAAMGVFLLSGEEYEEGAIAHLGVNVEGAKIGLAVPQYTYDKGVEAIADLKTNDLFSNKIIGIDAGAGVVMAAERALEVYGLEGYSVTTSSSPAMLSALDSAFAGGEDIVVTMWNPHWAVGKYDLVYLEDPEGVFGDEERIASIGNAAWVEANPEAAGIAERFGWDMADIHEVMGDIADGDEPAAAAQKWVSANQATVDGWLDGVTGEGSIRIGLVNWECAVASSNVMKLVLEQAGFEVTLVETDAGIMYAGLARGDTDLSFTAWIPLTHASYYERYVTDHEDHV